jgi:HK97 gp10 family phage protein
MAGVKLSIEGLSEVTQEIAKLKNIPKREMMRELRRVASPLVREARSNLRANGSVKSGRLSRSIKVVEDKATAGVYVSPTYRGGKNSSAAYAHLVEEGTRTERRLKRPVISNLSGSWRLIKSTGKMPAKPFMKPALETKGAEVVRRAQEALAKLLLRNVGVK